MKNKILLAILAIALVCGMTLAGCKDSGGETVIPPPPPPPAEEFTTIAEFKTWLEEQPDNTAETPYDVKVNVSDLGDDAGSLRSALLDNDNKYVNLDLSGSTLTSIGDYAFSDCTSLTGITIPNSVTSIGQNAFQHTSLTSVTIPASVTSIGELAFQLCTSLTSVTIPNSVTTIGSHAFYGCTSLAAINVNPANSAYASENGVLYNKAKTSLIQYPAGKTDTSFTIPAGVTSIGDIAFRNCTSLTGITIPNGVTSIGVDAFRQCTSLADITIPNSVTSIGWSAFEDCISLTSVTFETGSNIASGNFGAFAFPQGSDGDGGNNLRTAYITGKAGTYTRDPSGSTWTKSS